MPAAATAVSGNAADVRYRDEVFSAITVDKDIQYGTAPDLEDQHASALMLDVYRPADDVAALRPAIIWVHGGGFAKGDKGDNPAAYMSTRFAKMGYVAVSINYRLLHGPGCSAAHGIAPACFNAGVEAVRDAQAAVRWLRANAAQYGIDADRIAIAGESAGGIVASGVGVASDFTAEDGVTPGTHRRFAPGSRSRAACPRASSSIPAIPPGSCSRARTTTSSRISGPWRPLTRCKKAGATAVLERLEGAGHVPWAEYGDLFEQRSTAFLYDHLDLDGAAR